MGGIYLCHLTPSISRRVHSVLTFHIYYKGEKKDTWTIPTLFPVIALTIGLDNIFLSYLLISQSLESQPHPDSP